MPVHTDEEITTFSKLTHEELPVLDEDPNTIWNLYMSENGDRTVAKDNMGTGKKSFGQHDFVPCHCDSGKAFDIDWDQGLRKRKDYDKE